MQNHLLQVQSFLEQFPYLKAIEWTLSPSTIDPLLRPLGLLLAHVLLVWMARYRLSNTFLPRIDNREHTKPLHPFYPLIESQDKHVAASLKILIPLPT
ncbi:hypothetical protein D3C81_1936000 [compost metagenome]